MKVSSITVSVSVADSTKQGYSFSPDHPMNTDKTMFLISGKLVVAEPFDFETDEATEMLNKQIGLDFGSLDRKSKDGVHEAGAVVDIAYILNNGGLRLAYGDLAKSKYRKQGGVGRIWAAALAWAAASPSTLPLVMAYGQASDDTAKDVAKQAIIDAFEASKS